MPQLKVALQGEPKVGEMASVAISGLEPGEFELRLVEPDGTELVHALHFDDRIIDAAGTREHEVGLPTWHRFDQEGRYRVRVSQADRSARDELKVDA